MLRFTPLLLLPLLLAACALPVRDGMVLRAPQESPTAKTAQEGPGAFERVAGQETQNGAFLMGENQAAAIVEPTLDANATVAASLVALKAAQDETARLQSQLADEKARAVTVLLQIAEAERETAKYNAANRSSEQAQEADRIAKVNADAHLLEAANEAKRLDAELAQAQADAEDAKTRQYLIFFVSVLSICAALLVARLIRVRQVAAVEAEPQERDEFPELHKLNPAPRAEPYTPMVKRVIPAHVPEGVLIRFAQTVKTSHNPGGVPFSRAKWVDAGMMSRRSWDALMDFFSVHEYALKLGDADSSPMAFTPEGGRYLRGFENDPLPDGELSLST